MIISEQEVLSPNLNILGDQSPITRESSVLAKQKAINKKGTSPGKPSKQNLGLVLNQMSSYDQPVKQSTVKAKKKKSYLLDSPQPLVESKRGAKINA